MSSQHAPGGVRLLTIYITFFTLTSASGVVFVFLEDVQTDNGLADWQIGVVAATGFAAGLVAQLGLAPLADRGNLTPLAIVTLTAGVVGPVGFAFADDFVLLAVTRGLTGVGFGLYGVLARKALIGMDSAGGGTKLGTLLSVGVAGFIVGPFIGAALEPAGFEAPFIAVSAAVLVTGIPAMRTILASPIATTHVEFRDIGSLIARPRIQAALLVNVIVFGYIGVFNSVVDRYLTDLGASTTTVGIVILCIGSPLLVLPRFSGGLAERRGGSTVMLPALIVIVPVMFGYGLATAPVAIALVGLLHGVGESFAAVASQVLVLEVTRAERAAVGASLIDSAGFTAASLTALIAPTGYGAVDDGVFLITGAVGVVLALTARWRVSKAWD